MPGYSGYDVFEALKKKKLLQSNNIIIFTASSINEADTQSLLAEGAKVVLKKPLSIEELGAVIERFKAP
jgi:CheY-like chemotaxis protein